MVDYHAGGDGAGLLEWDLGLGGGIRGGGGVGGWEVGGAVVLVR